MRFFFTTLVFLSMVFKANAQELPTCYKNHLYLNPVDLFSNTLRFTYERTINPNKNSFAFDAGVMKEKITNVAKSGFDAALQYRIAVFDFNPAKACTGNIYVAPYIEFMYINYNDVINNLQQFQDTFLSRDANLRGYGTGMVMGISTPLYKDWARLGIYGGIGIKGINIKGYRDAFNTEEPGACYEGVSPKAGLQFGVSF